jgi:lysozyme
MDRAKLAAQLEVDERKCKRIYVDTVGKVTGGIGRNMTDRDFSDDEIVLMLKNDIYSVETDLDRNLPWWRGLSEARQNALANMCFNLGIVRLLTFKNMLKFLQAGRWDIAADEAKNSKWATQVGARADRIVNLIRKGEF